MGNLNSVFSNEELAEYEELTFLTKKEILHAWEKWKEIMKKPENYSDRTEMFPVKGTVMDMPELKYNPFREQISRQFGRRGNDGQYYMNFEHFLELLHVMSPRTPLMLKAHHAFKIFDIDGDHNLDEKDLSAVLDLLTNAELGEDDKKFLIDRLLNESDMEGDGAISEEEFKHLLNKCPDFMLCFRFTI